jgi:hypothetical protein
MDAVHETSSNTKRPTSRTESSRDASKHMPPDQAYESHKLQTQDPVTRGETVMATRRDEEAKHRWDGNQPTPSRCVTTCTCYYAPGEPIIIDIGMEHFRTFPYGCSAGMSPVLRAQERERER